MVEPEETIEHGQKYYVVRIGYNGNDRYETYHLLYVNKQDRSDIRIEDPIEGTIIPLAQWEEEMVYNHSYQHLLTNRMCIYAD